MRGSNKFQGLHEHSAWDPITDVTHDVVRCRILFLQWHSLPQTSVFPALMSQKRSQEEKESGEKRDVWMTMWNTHFLGHLAKWMDLSQSSPVPFPFLHQELIPTDQLSASFNKSASGSLLCFTDLIHSCYIFERKNDTRIAPPHQRKQLTSLWTIPRGTAGIWDCCGATGGSWSSPYLSWVQKGQDGFAIQY